MIIAARWRAGHGKARSDMNTNGRGTQPNVVITGASTGIGEASALRLASMGFRVFAGVRKQVDADALLQKSVTLQPIMLDVTDAESIAAAERIVADAVGARGLAGLVN